jgi:hypothetical protein
MSVRENHQARQEIFFAPNGPEEEILAINSIRRTQRLAALTFGLAALGVVGLLWLAFAEENAVGRIASTFFGLGEPAASVTGEESPSEALAVAGGETETSGDGDATASQASLSPRAALLVDDIASGPSVEAASFVDEPRQVRRLRRGREELGERGWSSRSRDREKVRSRIQAAGPSIQQCYERRMSTKGRISGTVYIRFNASASGTITNVSARSHDVRDRDLLLCVRSRLSGVRLERGAVETYRVPLRLVPSE